MFQYFPKWWNFAKSSHAVAEYNKPENTHLRGKCGWSPI